MRESENCSHNCRECGSDCAERREPQSFLEEPNAGTHVKKVIGIVENMAYFECPSCYEKHFIFGESHVKQSAEEYEIGMTAQIPVEPRLASVCDSGSIADFEAGWLSGLAEGIEAGGGKK